MGQALGTVVKMRLGHSHPILECLNLCPSSASDSSSLLMHIPGGSSNRSSICSTLWVVVAIWGVNWWIEELYLPPLSHSAFQNL